MKRATFSSVILTLLILLSLMLSNLLIFDNNFLLKLINRNQETAQINIQNDSLNIVTDYYRTTDDKLADVLYPTNVIISQNEQAYLLNDYSTLRSLATSLSQKRITLVGDVIEVDSVTAHNVISQEKVEMEFSSLMPVNLVEHFVKNESNHKEFLFNRIIFPLNTDDNKVILFNSLENRYMEARLPEGASSEEYLTIASVAKDNWLKSQRYVLANNDYVYLPTKNFKVSSKLYSLNQTPENQLVSTLFSDKRIWRYATTEEDSSTGVVSYYNADIDLKINILSQMMTINYKNANLLETQSISDKIVQGFNQIKQFEYWNKGIRFVSSLNNPTVVFQRYLAGLPIFSPSSTNHYASSRVVYRSGNSISSIYRVMVPMIYLEAFIPDKSQEVVLENVDEIVFALGNAGFDLDDFTRIVVGYEWQAEMANFQKVSFVPTWYFEKNNIYYSLQQIESGALNPSGQVPLQEEHVDGMASGGDLNGF